MCTEKAKEKIESEFQEYNVDVEAVAIISGDDYKCTQDILDIVEELYEETDSRALGKICLFRPCNMPADRVLPDFVKDISKLPGLFQRKEEV